MTISDLELSVQTALEAMRDMRLAPEIDPAKELLLPEGLTPVVALVQEDGRRKRSGAAAGNWNPQSDRIVISFRPTAQAVEAHLVSARHEDPENLPSANGAESATAQVAPRFQPIAVRGVPVSATLLHDRGSI